MADFTSVQFRAEWHNASPVPGTMCGFKAVPAIKNVAVGFADRMQKLSHSESFRWGNAKARGTDFEHPERDTNGRSLHWIDGHPQQALCVVYTFIEHGFPGIHTSRGDDFTVAVSRGTPVATAWVDTASNRSGSDKNRPIPAIPRPGASSGRCWRSNSRRTSVPSRP
jgi:hypothetical protein